MKISGLTTVYQKNQNLSATFLIFCLLAVILRFLSFFPSVIDHDESTYLEIARMLLSGKTLYVDMIDIKPPGIFLVLAGFQAIISYSLFTIRLLFALWIAATAFILYLSVRLLVRDDRSAIASGVIYIFFTSTWSFYGISITPEIFFNLFTISALYILLKYEKPARYFWAGLLAGIGFIIKYLVLFDFAAFILFFIFFPIENRSASWRTKIGNRIFLLFLSGAGFLLPFGITNLWYYLNGHFQDFYNIVYLSPARYPSVFDPWKMLKFVLDFHLRFLPLLIFYYYALFHKGLMGKEIFMTRRLVILWSVMALLAVLAAGKTFGHYMIQLMLPVSLAAGLFFHSERKLPAVLARLTSRKTGRLILLFLILLISMMKVEYLFKKDIPREIASYLETRLEPGDVIYTGNYHHIIYYLLQKDSPTKYVHRSLLLGENHIKALDIKADEEFRHIMAQQPVYIIIEKEYPTGPMLDFINENYSLEKVFDDKVKLYKRNPN